MSLDCWIRTCRMFVILCRTVRSACFRGVAHELMKGQGASMREQILDLIDFTRVDALLEGFNASTGFVTAILDLDGRILSRSGWRRICTEFHRVHPETSLRCTRSDTVLAGKLAEGESYHHYTCLNGLVDVAVPIIIRGDHIANLFSGQFFFEEPDRESFLQQARAYGFDQTSYMRALDEVPVVSREEVRTAMRFLQNMTELISEMTYGKLEQQELNQALQESESRFRQAVMGAPFPIMIHAEDGEVVTINRPWSALTGYEHHEIPTIAAWTQKAYGGRRQQIEAIIADTYTIEESSAEGEFPVTTKSGDLLIWDFSSSRIGQLPDGRQMVISMAMDVTERKSHLKALRKANLRLESSQRTSERLLKELKAENLSRKAREDELEKVTMAIEQAGEVIMITDTSGTIQYINPAFEQVSGYSRDQAIGQKPSIVQSGKHDAEFYRQFWKTISSGEIWHGRLVNKRKDGKLYTEDVTISPVTDPSGRIINYVGVKREITAQLELEAQLRQSQKMESVGRLAGGVAHDYNNMLSIILGYTEMALQDTEASDQLQADLKEVYSAAERSADLTRQLLAFARKQTVEPRVLDLNTTVEGMLNMLRRLLGEDISLLWQPSAALWSVRMDPSQLDQILANLCVNARDAITGVGKIIIETANVMLDDLYCTLHLGAVAGAYVMLAVSDDGSGMDELTREQIFEPFFTTKQIGKGTGIGLSTVYGIVKQNDGYINVYSEPGEGTTFRIYIPREIVDAADEQSAAPAGPVPGNGETILLVEDEPILLTMTTLLLQRLGYRVLKASGPDAALQQASLHRGEIHLLLTDVIMPEMNGRELSLRITADDPGIRCLFMSGYTADVIAHQGVLDAGLHFLQKPMSLHELAAKVRQVLDAAHH